MKLHPRLSRAAVELVKRFETFEPRAVSTPIGWTIGYGHTRTARAGVEISHDDAQALLLYDLSAAAELVANCTFAPVTQNQFEAMTALAFNVGPEGFRGSTALACVNAGAYLEAADEIERWRVAELGAGTQVVDALVRRRAAEKAHFLSVPPGAATSATPRLRPLSTPVEPASEDPPACATLTAADTVQARLRELIPDPAMEADEGPAARRAAEKRSSAAIQELPEPDAPDAPDAPDPDVPGVSSGPDAFPTLAQVRPPPGPAAPRIEPPPPPFANDHSPTPDPLSKMDLRGGDVSPSSVSAPMKRARGLTIWPPLLLAIVGITLFVGAALTILQGRPNLPSLAIGVVGAVAIACSLYAGLGRRRS